MYDGYSIANRGNWGAYSRPLAHKFSLNASALMCELIQMRDKLYESGETIEIEGKPGWFYATIDRIEERTSLSRKEQDKALSKLKEAGFLLVSIKGLPAKRYFCFNPNKEQEFIELLKGESKNDCYFAQKGQTGMSQRDKLDSAKGTNSHIYRKQDIENKGESAPKGAAPPTSISISRSENVATSQEEHQKLIAKYGEETTQECYQLLSEWKKSADPKQVKKHKSDYYRIIKWVAGQILESKNKQGKQNENTKSNIRKDQYERWIKTNGDPNENTNILRFN